MGSTGIDESSVSFTSALEGGGWSRTHPGNDQAPVLQRLGGPQGRSGRVRKLSPLLGFDLRLIQLVGNSIYDPSLHPIIKIIYI
jgi:hypothetical protein